MKRTQSEKNKHKNKTKKEKWVSAGKWKERSPASWATKDGNGGPKQAPSQPHL
jgi:hypothetical protein